VLNLLFIQVKLWQIPDGGIVGSLTNCIVDLRGHMKKISYIEWHPTAADILLSSAADFKVSLQCIIMFDKQSSVHWHLIMLECDIAISWQAEIRVVNFLFTSVYSVLLLLINVSSQCEMFSVH